MVSSTANTGAESATETADLQNSLRRGITALESGNRTEAHSIFKQASEAYPNAADVWVWLGGTTGDISEAESAFAKAHQLDPQNEKAALGLRWVQLRRDNATSAISGSAVSVPAMPAMPEPTATGGAQIFNTGTDTGTSTSPSDAAWTNTASTEPAPSSAPSNTLAGLPRMTWLIIAAVILVLAALGYWYFVMR
jgi:tetratricopeptide (TPR) repeat protein